MKFSNADWDRWVEWLDLIRKDLSRIRNDASIFATYREVIAANRDWISQNHGDRFCQFVVRSYVSAATLGVRRHVKIDRKALSMARLLDQIHKCADQITFDFYQARFPRKPDDVDWQSRAFSDFSDDGTSVSTSRVSHDIAILQAIPGELERYADRALAHLDPRGLEGSFTFEVLDGAIRKFDDLVCRYEVLLTGRGCSTLESVVQYPWTRIFNVPLRRQPA